MKDKKILLAVILTSVFLIITGITYAYFSLVVSGNDVAETINVSTTKIELIYTDGNEIKVDSIEPKWTTTKTITVENTGNEEAYYALGWQKLYNEIQKDELVIRSTCTSTGATGGTCSSTDNVVIPQTSEVTAEANKVIYPYKENVLILPGETHTYTVTIEFINYEDKHQNYNQGKRFYGVLGAAESSEKINFANYIIDNYSTLGLTKIDQASTGNQNYATTEYRYQGKTPNNYITFNDEVGVWRIIGVFEVETPQSDGTYAKENKIKIVRNGTESTIWSNGILSNNWTTTFIMTALNNGVYYTMTNAIKSQISTTKWYLGNVVYNNGYGNTKEIYTQERSTKVWNGNSQTWDGKVALIYPSDYMYASSGCYNDDTMKGYNSSDSSKDYRSEICKSTNWLFDTNKEFWTLSPTSYASFDAISVDSSGYVSFGNVTASHFLRPSVYLSSSVGYVSGDGTAKSPFVIQ